MIEEAPEIAIGPSGDKLVSKEVVVLISLPKRDQDKPANVVIRGMAASSILLRSQVKLIEGRLPKTGSSEIIAGLNIAKRFKGGGMG